MFEPIEAQPRRADGTYASPWIATGVEALVIGMVQIILARQAAHVQALAHNWVAQTSPVQAWLNTEMERRQADWAAEQFNNVEPEDAAKPQIQLDIEAAKRRLASWKHEE